MKKEQISFVDIFSLFLSNWWKIAISATLATVISFVITSYYIMPTYTSRGSIYVTNNNIDIQNEQYVNLTDIATSQQLAFTFIEILTSDTFLKRVQEVSQLPYPPAHIKSMVSMEPLNETEIVEVRAVTFYPEHSQKLVDTIINHAFDEVHRVIGGGSVKIIDEATLPEAPTSPSLPRNMVLGFIIGALFSMVIIFLINMFDNRIKVESDLMEVRELPLLGIIPDVDYVRAEVKKNGHK